MTALMVERTKHDLSWRGVESSVRHGLALAAVPDRPIAATVTQTKKEARLFVNMGIPSIADFEAKLASKRSAM
jgi:hypothetical protein